MKITLLKYPMHDDWLFMKQCTLVTVNKQTVKPPSFKFRRQILEARHSPIRVLQFAFLLEDIPYWVSVHLVRHVHSQPFVATQRNDRQTNYDRNSARQDVPVNMIWYMNAEELMTIANKRLCMKASKETREVVKQMCDLVTEKFPEFDGLLVPMCEWRGGLCSEIEPCGRGGAER